MGLKNAGATCYMNSVLQQLYMLPPIRDSVLKLDEAAQDMVVQQQEEEKKEPLERPVNRPSKTEVSPTLKSDGFRQYTKMTGFIIKISHFGNMLSNCTTYCNIIFIL